MAPQAIPGLSGRVKAEAGGTGCAGGGGRRGAGPRLWRGVGGAVGEDRWKGDRAAGVGGTVLAPIGPGCLAWVAEGGADASQSGGRGATRISLGREVGGPRTLVGAFAPLVMPGLGLRKSPEHPMVFLVDAQ